MYENARLSNIIVKFIGTISTSGKDKKGINRYIITIPIQHSKIAKKYHGTKLFVKLENIVYDA